MSFEPEVNSINYHNDTIFLFSNENYDFYLFKNCSKKTAASSELKIYNSKTTWWKTFRTFEPIDTNALIKNNSYIRKIRFAYKIMTISPAKQNSMLFTYLLENNDPEKALKFAESKKLSINKSLSKRLKEKIMLSSNSKQTIHLYKKYNLNNRFTDIKIKQAKRKKYVFEKYSKWLSIILLLAVFVIFMIKPGKKRKECHR